MVLVSIEVADLIACSPDNWLHAGYGWFVRSAADPVHTLRVVAIRASSLVLTLLLFLLVVRQLAELQGASELLPITAFAVLLSLSSLALNWSRTNPDWGTEPELRSVKRSGLDLFIAAILNLVAACLLQVAQSPFMKGAFLLGPVLLLHVVFISIGLVIGWFALVSMLRYSVLYRESVGDVD